MHREHIPFGPEDWQSTQLLGQGWQEPSIEGRNPGKQVEHLFSARQIEQFETVQFIHFSIFVLF